MKIILKENVADLGYKDDVVDVKDGYGRNYLIPTGKAVIATSAALKQLAENQKQQAHKIAKAIADAEAAAAKLEGLTLTLTAKTDAKGTIYGSVGAAQIAEALVAAGHEIDRKIVTVKDTVKTCGDYVAVVRFHKEVAKEVPFTVVSENMEVVAPVAEEAPAAEETPAEVAE